MQFQVPQHVTLEDKLAFRLTLKQLGWFALGGVILFLFWITFEKWVFWTSFPFVVAGAVAFSFYKPAGITMIEFLIGGIKYKIRPKKLTWEKGLKDITPEDRYGKRELKTDQDDYENIIKKKQQKIKNIGDLAKMLDEKSNL